MTKYESGCILFDDIKKKNSNKTGIEKVREYHAILEKYWYEKESSLLNHCKKNMDCYSKIEICYAEPLMRLANKLGGKLVKAITKLLSDEDLISYSKEVEILTNFWVTKKSQYAGLYHELEKKQNVHSDKSPNYSQTKGTVVGDDSSTSYKQT